MRIKSFLPRIVGSAIRREKRGFRKGAAGLERKKCEVFPLRASTSAHLIIDQVQCDHAVAKGDQECYHSR
jgi:hypothetical protein